jgi:hypothetical protein
MISFQAARHPRPDNSLLDPRASPYLSEVVKALPEPHIAGHCRILMKPPRYALPKAAASQRHRKWPVAASQQLEQRIGRNPPMRDLR